MKCSVAMASYNGASYIERQSQSILDQTIPVDEVIISDDGSSDGTADMVNEFIQNNKLVEVVRYFV